MGLSILSKECSECPFFEKCQHKQMEELGYPPEPILSPVVETSVEELAQPILRETMTIIVEAKPQIVYKDDIKNQLYKHLYSGLGLQFGD